MKKYIKIILLGLVLAVFLVGCKAGDKVKEEDLIDIPEVEDVEDPGEDLGEDSEANEDYEPILAESFVLKNLQGQDLALEDYRGKIVYLNFWATWCQWCDIEMPDLQRIADENDDLVVVGINSMEDKKTVEKYVEKNNLKFDILLDEDGEVSRQYFVSGLPTTYFLDKEGYILGAYPGALDYESFDAILNDIRELSGY